MSEVIVRRTGEEAGKGRTYSLRPSELKAVAEGLWPGQTHLHVHQRRNQDLSQVQRTQLRLSHRRHLVEWSYRARVQPSDPRLRPSEERIVQVVQYGLEHDLLNLPLARREALLAELRSALLRRVPTREPWPDWSLRVDLDSGQRLLDWTFEGDGQKETWTTPL